MTEITNLPVLDIGRMDACPASQHPETLALHGGQWRADPATGAVAIPIYQSTSFQFKDTGRADRLFALDELGFIYSRVTNPTFDALEQRIAALEGGAAALAVSSGQAASAYSVLNLAGAGDNIVSSTDLCGGTWALSAATLKHLGVEVRFVDPTNPENFRRATDARIRAYDAESLPNPKLDVFPIAEVAAIGRKLGVPLIIDNTAAPLLIRPFEHGAAAVVYSATKYLGGHGTTIGGLIVDGGNFPWDRFPERCPTLHQPDPSYHGAVWLEKAKALGPVAYVLCARCVLLRDIGAANQPLAAFQLLQGIETLPLRIRQHNENAVKVALFLKDRPDVARVIYPGLHAGEAGRRARLSARRLWRAGRLRTGRRARGRARVHRRAETLSSCRQHRRCAIAGDPYGQHDAFATHRGRAGRDRRDAGLWRLSIGIEHPDDIIADLAQALDAAGAGPAAMRHAA